MTNAARLLLDYLEGMTGAIETHPERRMGKGPDVWRDRVRALGYLQDIEDSLAAMQAGDQTLDVETYREALLPCYYALLGYIPRWGTGVGRVHLLEASDLRSLRMVATYLDVAERASLEDEPRKRLIDTLMETLSEVARAPYLEPATRGYLGELLGEAVLALANDSKVSDWAMRRKALEAGGALQAVAETTQVPEAKRSWFRDKAAIITTAVITAAASETTNRAIEAGGKAIALLGGSAAN